MYPQPPPPPPNLFRLTTLSDFSRNSHVQTRTEYTFQNIIHAYIYVYIHTNIYRPIFQSRVSTRKTHMFTFTLSRHPRACGRARPPIPVYLSAKRPEVRINSKSGAPCFQDVSLSQRVFIVCGGLSMRLVIARKCMKRTKRECYAPFYSCLSRLSIQSRK